MKANENILSDELLVLYDTLKRMMLSDAEYKLLAFRYLDLMTEQIHFKPCLWCMGWSY